MLEVVDLHKRFGSVVALDGLGFTVRPGRITGFLGANGAGKTTAMRAVFGILQPDAGEVRYGGRPVDRSLRRRFGYLPEQRGLYPRMTLVDQLVHFGRLQGMSKVAARRSAAALLDELGLGGRAGDRLEALSHGNQQRVQLAAALVHGPELLVLDEPFSGLDPLGVAALVEVLRARTAVGGTVVFSSHQLDLVEDLCEDVVLIDAGRLVLAGPLVEVQANSPLRVAEMTFADPPGAAALDALGAVTLRRGGRAVALTVAADSDPAALLATAQRIGPVLGFTYRAPSVTEIFRAAVAP